MSDQIIQVPSNNDGMLGGGGIGSLLIGAMLFGGRGGFGGGFGGNGSPAAAAVATDVVLNPAFQSLQTQIQTLSGQVNNNSLASTIEHETSETTDAVRHLDDQLTNGFAGIQNSISNVMTAQAANNYTTLTSINGLGRDVTAQGNQNALQQLNSFNNLTTTTLQGFNGAAMQVQNITNQIVAQGTALSSQLASCCCDLRIQIKADGDDTRALINSINLQNIQGQLADAKSQISNFNQTQVLLNALRPSTIV